MKTCCGSPGFSHIPKEHRRNTKLTENVPNSHNSTASTQRTAKRTKTHISLEKGYDKNL